MAKYRKKPVIVEAEVYKVGMEDGFIPPEQVWISDRYQQPKGTEELGYPFVETEEGCHFISEGDYIIVGTEGERYPCSPEAFRKIYEPVEDQDDS